MNCKVCSLIMMGAFAALVSVLCPFTVAFAGTRGGGGGTDPKANQFLELAELIYTAQLSGAVDLKMSNEQLRAKIDEIRASLEGQNPLVVFEPGEKVDCFGAPKLGCVRDGKIHYAKAGWRDATREERIQATTMELVLSVGGRERYAIGESVAKILTFDREAGPGRLLSENGKRYRLRPLFNKCSFPLVRQAVSLAGGDSYPQFDVSDRHDGLENLTSFKLYDPEDEFKDEADDVVKSVLFVSLINNQSDPAKWMWSYQSPGVSPLVQPGGRIQVHRHYWSWDSDDEHGCIYFSRDVYNSEFLNNGPQPSYVDGESTRKNKSIPQRGKGAHDFFPLCTRMALNKALELAAKDNSYPELSADSYPGKHFDLRSAHVERSRESNTETYVFSIETGHSAHTQSGIRIPHFYKIATRSEGNSCRILAIRGT